MKIRSFSNKAATEEKEAGGKKEVPSQDPENLVDLNAQGRDSGKKPGESDAAIHTHHVQEGIWFPE